MRTVNKVILLGRITRDAETSFTPSQISVTKFSVATEDRYKDKASGEWKSTPNFTNVVLWRGEGVAPYLLKGTQVYVDGKLQTRSYEKDGRKVYVTEVFADSVILCGGKGEPAGKPEPISPGAIDDDDVPFNRFDVQF